MSDEPQNQSNEQDPYDKPPERKPKVDPYGNPVGGVKPKNQQQGRYIRVPFPGAVKTPYITYALLAINAFIFAFYIIDIETYFRMVEFGYMDIERIVNNREIYRLFTAMFLHADPTHIVFNGLGIYYIGANVERMFGRTRYLLVYFLGGLTGSVVSVLFNEGGLGASGAVFAIFGAETLFFYMHRQLFGAAGMERVRRSAILIGINFIFGIFVNVVNTTTGEGALIGNFAHLGGLIGGVAVAWLIAPRFHAEKVDNPQVGESPIRIREVNPLGKRITPLLYYSVGLAGVLLLALVVQA